MNNSETLFDESIFLSEKICKPILSLHPFIIVGSPRMLQKLHQLGFKTFEPFISEKYDDVINQKERLELVFKELDKFNKTSLAFLEIFFFGVLLFGNK